ncbi:MAG: hypothetical protein ACE5FN_02930 [Leptospirillia bacterium]
MGYTRTSPENLGDGVPLTILAEERGMVLVITLFLLALLTTMGATANLVARTNLRIAANFSNDVRALYLAEAGLQRALGNLNNSTSWYGTLATPEADSFPGDNALGRGTYTVQVFADQPSSGSYRVVSTSSVNGSNASVRVSAILSPSSYPVFDYASFTCGNLVLNSNENTTFSGGDVFASGNANLGGPHSDVIISGGDLSALGNIDLNGATSVSGNVFANGNIRLDSSASPNVGGDVTAGGAVMGGGTVGGSKTSHQFPDPVNDPCTGPNLADMVVTAEAIQDLRNNADTTYPGNFTVASGGGITLTGVVHVTGNFRTLGDVTFFGDVVFIVDGNAEIDGNLTANPAGARITFLVPGGNFIVKNSGNVTLDGTVLAGTVNADGTGIQGGNVIIQNGAHLTVNGALAAIAGNTISSSGGELTINAQGAVDPNLVRGFHIATWRRG